MSKKNVSGVQASFPEIRVLLHRGDKGGHRFPKTDISCEKEIEKQLHSAKSILSSKSKPFSRNVCTFPFCRMLEQRHRPLLHSDRQYMSWDHFTYRVVDIDPFSSFGLKKLPINEEFGCWLRRTKHWTVSDLCLKVPKYQCALLHASLHHLPLCCPLESLDPVFTARPS